MFDLFHYPLFQKVPACDEVVVMVVEGGGYKYYSTDQCMVLLMF